MTMLDLLEKKKRGGTLTEEEIRFFVRGVKDETIPDYQLSAFLMAVCFVGLSDEETAVLTLEMARSGDMLDLSSLPGCKVDKHSTGGVGDKTTLVAAPIAAACGATVAKLSGRGLGHTGGTLDKLESIPGLSVSLSREQFLDQVARIGLCVAGQTGNIAPVDKRLYALRDVTCTVDSLPLIASSIMSKKLASGADAIVLDVKCGSGAFMKTPEDARALAEAMVEIGRRQGRKMSAVLSNMDLPLGREVGNALEVKEAILTLRGQGPEDFTALCLTLAEQMLKLAGIPDPEAAARNALESGAALEKLREMIAAQGGDPRVTEDPGLLPAARHTWQVPAPESGVIAAMDTAGYGSAACALGAGRLTKEDPIVPGAGVTVLKKTGDRVLRGETLAVLHADDPALFPEAQERLLAALTISREAAEPLPLVLGIVE